MSVKPQTPSDSRRTPVVPRLDVLKHSTLLRGSYNTCVNISVKRDEHTLWFTVARDHVTSMAHFVRDIVDYYIENIDCSYIPKRYAGIDTAGGGNATVGIRVTKQQSTKWDKVAQDMNIPLTTFIRLCVNHFISSVSSI